VLELESTYSQFERREEGRAEVRPEARADESSGEKEWRPKIRHW
jgi:hypothetical protein